MKKLHPIRLALILATLCTLATTARAAPSLPENLANAPASEQTAYLEKMARKALEEKKALARQRHNQRRQTKADLSAGLKAKANAYQEQVQAERAQTKSKLDKSADGMNVLFHILFVLMLLGATGGFIYYWRPETFQIFSTKK